MPNRGFTVNNSYPGRTSSVSTRGPNDGSAGTGTGRPRGKLTSAVSGMGMLYEA